MVKVSWAGGMAFDAVADSGNRLRMDAYGENGEPQSGPTPVETLLASLAACSAMDVVSILAKKRQKIDEYWVEIDGERVPPGSWPRPFLSITVRHVLRGEGIDPAAVEQAVQLTDEKYCSVIATLRAAPKIESVFEILP